MKQLGTSKGIWNWTDSGQSRFPTNGLHCTRGESNWGVQGRLVGVEVNNYTKRARSSLDYFNNICVSAPLPTITGRKVPRSELFSRKWANRGRIVEWGDLPGPNRPRVPILETSGSPTYISYVWIKAQSKNRDSYQCLVFYGQLVAMLECWKIGNRTFLRLFPVFLTEFDHFPLISLNKTHWIRTKNHSFDAPPSSVEPENMRSQSFRYAFSNCLIYQMCNRKRFQNMSIPMCTHQRHKSAISKSNDDVWSR